jgi:hypothetical protein
MPYILPPAELASIQKGHPTRTAVRSMMSERRRSGILAFCPSSHSVKLKDQKTRGTRARRDLLWCQVATKHLADLLENLSHEE